MNSLGTIYFWNNKSGKDGTGKSFDQFEAIVPEKFVGVKKPTILQALMGHFRKSTPFRLERTMDGSISVLHIRKADKDVEGIQVLSTDNTKYTVGEVDFRNEFYDNLTEEEQEFIREALFAAEREVEQLTFGKLSDNTARHVILRMCHGVTVRSEGGVYFVEEGNDEQFKQYLEYVDALVGESVFEVIALPVERTKRGIRSLAKAVKSDINTRLKVTMTKLKANTTQRGRRSRLAEINDLVDMGEFYADLLQEDLAETMSKLKLHRQLVQMEIEAEEMEA